MKKVILIICAMFIGISAKAQDEKSAVGVSVSYGSEIKNIGIGAKYQQSLSEKFRLEGAFEYFLKKDGVSMWDVSVNAHYLLPLADRLKVYPLAGITLAGAKVDGGDLEIWVSNGEEDQYGSADIGSSSETKFGFNLGAGLQYDLTDRLFLNVEAKYQLISDFDQAVVGVGLAYRF